MAGHLRAVTLRLLRESKFRKGRDKNMTIFDKLAVSYDEVDGLYYPLVSVKETHINVGKYGLLWMEYIKKNAPDRYKSLLRFGKLQKRASEVNEEAYEMLDGIMNRYIRRHPPDNPSSTIEMWKTREQTKTIAEEMVLTDIVYQYH